MKTLLLTLLLVPMMSVGQNVNIPDANFKAYLVGNTNINTNGDSEIQVSEASAFTGVIDCSVLNISDLTGIEAFTALTVLRCGYNQLTSLDVSNNTALTQFSCQDNQLTSLDVSSNTALTFFNCPNNQITSLDVFNNTALTFFNCPNNQLTSLDVSNNTALTNLYCFSNQLTSLDVSGATALTDLNCGNNQLTSLDVSSNTALTDLTCYNNQLTSLDVSSNTALTDLTCYNNQLTSLDVSSNTALTFFNCPNNQITSLDVSSNTALTHLNCGYNQLTSLGVFSNTALTFFNCPNNQITSLDVSSNTALTFLGCMDNDLNCLNVKNGNNTNVTNFNIYNNPNLTCVEVDDVNYAISSNMGTSLDPQMYFSTDCGNDCAACIPTSSIDFHTVCESYTWIDGNNYTASNNTATYTTINSAGCDSTITLDLTITPQSTSSIIKTACSFYIAPDDEVYTSTGNYTAIIDNAAGCDSVITIDLTINPTPSAAVTQNGATLTATQTGATYQWIDCDDESNIVGEINQAFTPAVTGNYAVIVTIGDCFKKSECFLVDFTGIGELNNTPKQLIKIVDVLGRETPFKPNTPLIYIYNDGTVERKVVIK